MLFSKKKKNNLTDTTQVLKNPKILEVNLIKDEAGMDFDWRQNIKAPLFALLAVIFIIVEIYLGLDWWEKDETKRLELIEAEVSQIGREINAFRQEAAPALAYQNKTLEVSKMLDNHIYWTNFFAWLERNTLSTVSYGGFSGSTNGKYSFSGIAGSFAEVSWQVKQLLEDPLTLSAKVATVNSGESKTKEEILAEQEQAALEAANNPDSEELASILPPGFGFSLDLEVSPEIFKK